MRSEKSERSHFLLHTSHFTLPTSYFSPLMQDIRDRTFTFAVRIVSLCQYLDAQPGVSRTLARQLLRSGTSIGANCEEAKAGQSRADFRSKYAIALKEARETHYWLRLFAATHIVPDHRLTDLQDEANQLVAILTTIVVRSEKRGEK